MLRKSLFGILLLCLLDSLVLAAPAKKLDINLYAKWKAEMIKIQEAIPFQEDADPVAAKEQLDANYADYYGSEWDKLESQITKNPTKQQQLENLVEQELTSQGYSPRRDENGKVTLLPDPNAVTP